LISFTSYSYVACWFTVTLYKNIVAYAHTVCLCQFHAKSRLYRGGFSHKGANII